ncbi:acetate--CoA ligase [Luminiphilus syltensis NOR5-1B]|uniref:Acetate--CoA ligase n=1 Tax=Luminiphilus syltensis NOR5-1B TaxID=565045 RepID=B8KVU7_9GAMM|nr:acyl--CoA ligase [Luminiphilus syltensis]EED34282.1 acetate--CoA ligase [Luminiphilus syltensis NOR5-1B]
MYKQLVAPLNYNIANEFEKFTDDPERVAIKWLDDDGCSDKITYVDLWRCANRIGNALSRLGLKKGDIALVMIPKRIEAYQTYIAALKLGIVVIPCSEMLREKELDYRINHSGAKAIISYFPFTAEFEKVSRTKKLTKIILGRDQDGWERLDHLMLAEEDSLETVATTRDDMSFLSYTSGTTGYPKGVVHTHGWGFAHLRTAARNWLCINEGDLVWATAGPGWAKWLWSPFLSVLGSGATGFVYSGKFDPETYLHLLDEYKINVLCCTPTEYRIMAKSDNLSEYDLSSLRSAVSAGEPLNAEVISTFQKHFNVTVRDGYGQTENTLLVGTLKDMQPKPGSMGRPTPGCRVAILDEEGQPVKTGSTGDIAVHLDTPALFKHYYNDPEKTSMSRRGDYYLTGDRAREDEDGYFWFQGRSDDIIISAGYTIGPFEVEDALVKHPAVQECAVVASPDEVRGSVVKAFVILKNGVSHDHDVLVTELQQHVKALTAPYKYPRKIQFVAELPKTTSGKIRRVELRQLEQEGCKY